MNVHVHIDKLVVDAELASASGPSRADVIEGLTATLLESSGQLLLQNGTVPELKGIFSAGLPLEHQLGGMRLGQAIGSAITTHLQRNLTPRSRR